MKASQNISNTQRHARYILQSLPYISFKYLFRETSFITNITIASLIALSYIVYLFPLSFLGGHSGLFERLEPSTSLSGWWAFKNGIWRFPLLKIPTLNIPEGANLAFTNSLPLLAILFKPFNYWLSKDFHYFGIWFLISYIAQAIGATLAMRALGQRTLLATIASAMMGLMMPVFLWQTDNIPLISQAYLLLGLALYFSGYSHAQSFKETANSFTLVLALAFLTHPYLFLMTSVFYLAFVGEYWLQSNKHHQNCLTTLLTTSLIIISIGILGGYFSQIWRFKGYGLYSMNLLAPFSGGRFGQSLTYAVVGQSGGFNY